MAVDYVPNRLRAGSYTGTSTTELQPNSGEIGFRTKPDGFSQALHPLAFALSPTQIDPQQTEAHTQREPDESADGGGDNRAPI